MYEDYEKLRKEKGLKDSDISRITGIAKSTLSDWKSGKSTPKLNKLTLIANALDVPLGELTEISSPDALGYDTKGKAWEANEEFYLNEDAKNVAQFLLENPEYKILFDASRKVKPEDLKKAVKALGIFTEEE